MNRLIWFGRWAIAFALAGAAAHAQFQEIKPTPFPPAIARQKIRALLENTDAGNRDRTVGTISDWLKWYRDILDDELIARWKSDERANVPLLMAPLADARLAREVVEYSWRVDRPAAFRVEYAPMFEDLMARYPESAKPFLDDLLAPAMPGQAALNLTQAEAEAACRILLDMPDIGAWRKNALQILPRYRPVADQLLRQDLGAPDQERVYRAQRWRMDLRLDPPTVSSVRPPDTRTNRRILSIPAAPVLDSQRPHIVGQTPSLMSGYTGPMSGTLESSGDPIPQNGEYVFENIPQVKLLLDFDTKHWEARLAPGEAQAQVLILRNKGKGPQKRCVVHWTVVQ